MPVWNRPAAVAAARAHPLERGCPRCRSRTGGPAAPGDLNGTRIYEPAAVCRDQLVPLR